MNQKRVTYKSVFPVSLWILVIMLAACGTRKENKAELEKMDEEAGDKIVSVELSDESYRLEYGVHFSFSFMHLGNTKPYTGTIEKDAVIQLLQSLDLKEKYLKEKMRVEKTEDGMEYNPELKGRSFLLYGIDDGEESVLLVTKTGEIYLQGVHYTGDKTAFKEAFSKFIQEETADEEEQQEKFMGFVDEIEWE